MIHFFPTRHECSARLGENLLSCCPSPLRAQELLPAQLLRSDKPSCPSSRGKQLCRESWSRRREVSSALLWPTLVPERQRKGKRLSHAGRTLLQSAATVLQPQKQAPLPLSPPTHTYIHSLRFTHTHTHTHTHSQLGSKISGQQGRPENSRKHQKQLQKLFMSVCECVIWGEFTCVPLCLKEVTL